MKKYILLFALFCSVNLFSQNITIKGKINAQKTSDSKQQIVRLITYNDMLTCEQTTVYETSHLHKI